MSSFKSYELLERVDKLRQRTKRQAAIIDRVRGTYDSSTRNDGVGGLCFSLIHL